MSLFQGLENFRGQLDGLTVLVNFRQDGTLQVSVNPIVEEAMRNKAPHLAMPFGLDGTAAELDASLADALRDLARERAPLAEQAKQQMAAMKTAAAKAAPKAGSGKPGAVQKASSLVKFGQDNAGAEEGLDEEDEVGGTGTAAAAAPVSAPAPAGSPQTSDNLF